MCYNLGMANTEDLNGGMPPDAARELQKEMALRNDMSRGMYLSDLDRFKDSLRGIDAAKNEEEKELAREEAYHHFDEIKKQELGHLEFIADKHMNFEFAFPYDSRQGAVWFMSMRRDLEDTLEVESEKGGFDGETRQWLENLYDAVVWGDANYGIQEGLNMITWYYGGLDAMASGLPNMKLRITSSKLSDANVLDIRGKDSNKRSAESLFVRKGEPTGEIKTEIREVKRGKTVQVIENKYLVRQKEAVENIREMGVTYQDEFFYWRHIVAAVAQYDYTNPTKEGLLKNSTLRKELEVAFVSQLFGEKDAGGNLKTVEYQGKLAPEAILNFYTMKDTKKNRREYRQLMEALMQCNAREELKKCEDGANPDGSLKVDIIKLQLLVNRVEETKKAIAEREKTKKSSLQDRVGSLVIKQGIVFDIGSANAAPLSWQYEYKRGKRKTRGMDGRIIPDSVQMLRRVDFGGINQAGDWYTPEFHVFHNLFYDKAARLRSRLILATPDRYRKQAIQEKNPFEKPIFSLEEAMKIDPWAANDVMKLIAGDDDEIIVAYNDGGQPIKQKAGEWRKNNKFRIDRNVRLALKDILYFQEVPLAIGEDQDKNPAFPLYPSFIPHRFKLSFFDHIKMKDAGGTTCTLGDKLRNGDLKLSTVNYEDDLKEHQWDRWLVDMNMGERLLRFMAEPGDARAQEAILNGVGTMKEAIKRAGLWNRDSFYIIEDGGRKVEVSPSVFENAIVAQMMILAAIKGNERGSGLQHDLLSHHIETTAMQDAWDDTLASHVMMAKYMPPDMGETEGTPEFYNETMALIMAITGNAVYRIALEGGTNEVHDKLKASKQLATMTIKRSRLKKRNSANLQ